MSCQENQHTPKYMGSITQRVPQITKGNSAQVFTYLIRINMRDSCTDDVKGVVPQCIHRVLTSFKVMVMLSFWKGERIL